MLQQIDKFNGNLIQKITKSNGELIRYQTVPENSIGDSSAVSVHTTLAAARKSIGWNSSHTLPEFVTKPKSANPQNQKGYRADSK